MLQRIFKNIIGAAIVLSLVTGAYAPIIAQPKKVEATVVTDIFNGVFNALSAIGDFASSAYEGIQSAIQYSLQLKEFSLDAIAYALAKQVLRQITTSVVNWINTGFEGSPSFITDPAGFFIDLGGEIIGDVISKNGDLRFLCSPFSIDVRLSLALKYQPFRKRVTCTLSDIIKNSTNAINGASINGFTAGDFKQGGWPAFVSMTTEPQNNVYGAYITAKSEIDARIGSHQLRKRDELTQGKGFLSLEWCKNVPVAGEANFIGPVAPVATDPDFVGPAPLARTEVLSPDFVGPENVGQARRQKKCEVQTPGSAISGMLETTLGSPIRELELADEFNEIINALFSQLVTKTLTGGLRSLSGNSSSDQNSYANQLINQQDDVRLIKSILKKIANGIGKYIKQESDYFAQKTTNLEYVITIQKPYTDAIICYETKITSNIPPLTTEQISYAREKIAEINTALLTPEVGTSTDESIQGVVNRLDNELFDSQLIIDDLNRIKTAVSTTLSMASSSEVSQQYSDLIDADNIHGPTYLGEARQERRDLRDFANLKARGTNYLRACEAFPGTPTP